MTSKKELLLVSGGLDSFVMWRLLDKPQLLYVMAGHRYQMSELRQLEIMQSVMGRSGFDIRITECLSLGDYEQADGFIPFRNLLFAIAGLLEYPALEIIHLGSLRGESSRDKTDYFFKQTSKLLTFLNGEEVKFGAPFQHLTKYGLVKEYLKQFPTPEDLVLLKLTTSCYNADGLEMGVKGCGECQACFRRWVAIYLNGILETYRVQPYLWNRATTFNGVMGGVKKHLPKIPPAHLPGVIENNALALLAVSRARKEAKAIDKNYS